MAVTRPTRHHGDRGGRHWGKAMTRETEYLRHRAREERRWAEETGDPRARYRHTELAEAYERQLRQAAPEECQPRHFSRNVSFGGLVSAIKKAASDAVRNKP
jgi:hypothetical protein